MSNVVSIFAQKEFSQLLANAQVVLHKQKVRKENERKLEQKLPIKLMIVK